MRKRQTALLMIVICVVSTMMGVGIAGQTAGPRDSGKNVGALADVITKSFSLTDTQASPGSDWCVQIEVEQKVNWWYTPNDYDAELDAHQSLYANRVKLIYQNVKDKEVAGFASLFLAIDLLKGSEYTILLNSQNPGNMQDRPPLPKLVKEYHFGMGATPLPTSIPADLGQIIFPSSNTICPSFSKILATLFNAAVYSWQPVGDPNCDDYANKCQFFFGNDGQYHVNRESFLPGCDPLNIDKCAFVYWGFNGVDHKISGAIRFLINVQLINGGPMQTGYLTIGFGGNGGAG